MSTRFPSKPNHSALRLISLCSLALFLLSLASCTEYWWSRGQAATVSQLIEQNRGKLADARATRGEVRQEVAAISEVLERDLLATAEAINGNFSQNDVSTHLAAARESFMKLEGKLSVSSRAAFGELAGQLRAFEQGVSGGKAANRDAFGLFTARTLSFLASELSVPAPNFG